MGEHTPGQWYTHKDAGSHSIWHVASMEPGQHIAVVGQTIIGDDEAQANALLVAAAPDLLAALEAVEYVRTFYDDGDVIPTCPWCNGTTLIRPDQDWVGIGHAPECPRQAAIAKAEGGQDE